MVVVISNVSVIWVADSLYVVTYTCFYVVPGILDLTVYACTLSLPISIANNTVSLWAHRLYSYLDSRKWLRLALSFSLSLWTRPPPWHANKRRGCSLLHLEKSLQPPLLLPNSLKSCSYAFPLQLFCAIVWTKYHCLYLWNDKWSYPLEMKLTERA